VCVCVYTYIHIYIYTCIYAGATCGVCACSGCGCRRRSRKVQGIGLGVDSGLNPFPSFIIIIFHNIQLAPQKQPTPAGVSCDVCACSGCGCRRPSRKVRTCRFGGVGAYMLKTRSVVESTVLYSVFFGNTFTLNMNGFLSYTGLTSRNTSFILLWLRHRNT